MLSRIVFALVLSVSVTTALSGCLLAAAGAGAQTGYVLSQEDRTASETMRDQAIVTQVKTKLLASRNVSGLDINVDSFKGNVTLRGVVSTEDQAQEAITLARSVSGVKDVNRQLFVP